MSGKGDDQADAAMEAARLQQQAAESGIAEQRAAFAQAQELQAPFLEMGRLASQLMQGQQRFEDQPFFRQLQEQNRMNVERQAASQGLLGSGARLAALQDANTQGRLGFINQLMQPGMSAANTLTQSRFGLGGNIANLQGQAANAQASGIVGAANAQSAADAQLMGTLGMLGGAALGGSFGGLGGAQAGAQAGQAAGTSLGGGGSQLAAPAPIGMPSMGSTQFGAGMFQPYTPV